MVQQIEAHRGRMRFNSDKEAVEDLILRGLASIDPLGAESDERHATRSQVRAAHEKLREIATKLAANQGADGATQALAEMKEVCDRFQLLLRQIYAVTGIVADVQSSQQVLTDLREFADLLDLWSGVYNRMIVSGVREQLVSKFKDHLHLVEAGRSLLQRLGIGKPIEEEIKVQRQLL